MLSSIRKFSKSFLAKIFVAIIALPFILWGVGDIFREGKQNVIVEINKEKVNAKEFVEYIQKIKLSSEEIKRVGKSKILDQILTNYISEKIILLETEEKGLKITDDALIKILYSDKSFQKDGKFSTTKYEKFMLTSGFTKPVYEKTVKDVELKGQLLNFYSGGIKLPSFIINDIYKKNNSSKQIQYLDLNEIYNKKNIDEKDIKDFYEKNKNFFKEKYKKFKYLELSPKIIIGKTVSDDTYFKKIEKIENDILDGKNFEIITSEFKKNVVNVGFVNSTKTSETGVDLKNLEDKLFNKFFSIQKVNLPEFVIIDSKYYIVEIEEEKEKITNLEDSNLKKTIIGQLKVRYKIDENNKLSKDISNKKFDGSMMDGFSKKNNIELKTLNIKNINDKSNFDQKLINEIYNFNKGQVFLLTDDIFKINYLMRIIKEDYPKIDLNSDNYKKNIVYANTEYIRKVYSSYDKYINAKYNVNVNNRVYERIKNSF